jgi:hypothetical protein
VIPGPAGRRIRLIHNQALVVSGWAIDLRTSQPAGGVTVEIDRTERLETDFGSRREDVANAFGNPNYADCEFTVVIPPVALPVGKHTISLLLLHPEDHGLDVAVMDALSVVVRPLAAR